ncbi:hypothetical protein BN946_scf185043.g244 [Trametes cinnabarina]|uniref:Uncharacterized protein n=1 Tax=Pycnoporus cinnabarinus TaxID=5643 RepID=A0A060SI59_PYCCI|nr:hypothetical protein BN946_scf185043.g244 [Trametes cinnabarina]
MNVQHPDMLRQGVPNMHQNLINQPFFPQPQQGQPSAPHNMGPFQNNQGTNPAALGLMGPQPGASNPAYPLNMQQPPQRRPGMFMGAPHSNPSGLNPAAAPGSGPSMAGLAPGQIQNMSAFPGAGMMGQQTIRRVQSQPMNQSAAHMGMQPAMMTGLGGPPNMAPLRAPMSAAQQQQMQLQMRQQQAQQQSMQGGAMSPDMGMPMSRPAHMQGPGAMPPHARTPSGQAQLMPPGMQQHAMQQQMQHNAFGNPMSLPHQHQHQQSQLGASQHISGSAQQQSNMGSAMGAAMGGNQLPLQAAANRAQMGPDNSMFMNFQNQLQSQQPIQPPVAHGVPRPPMHNPQFNVGFAGSPTPPNPGGEMVQRGNPQMAPSAPTTQGVMTPAQVLDKMSAGGAENFPTGTYGMGQPPVNPPQRPPSQHGHGPVPHNAFPMPQHQPAHPAHPPQHSPRQADRLAGQMPPPSAGMMQRPQSQPQVQHRQSPIPPGSSRTPRLSHPPLPMNAGGSMMPPGRIPPGPGPGPGPGQQSPQGPAHQQVQPPTSAPPSANHNSHQPMQIAPRPPSANAAAAHVRSAPPVHPQGAPTGQQGPPGESGAPAQHVGPSGPGQGSATAPGPAPGPTQVPGQAPAPVQPPQRPVYPVGFGQATCRILQFSGCLGVDHKDRLKQSYWTKLLAEYFTEKSTMKLTLWKDNQRSEAKPFEIGSLILPRFFLVTSQSGVKSMSISLDGGRERLVTATHALVECANAAWTFQYQNGYHITLRGPLSADVVVQPHPPSPPGSVSTYTLKLERLQFDAFYHDKFIALDAIGGERIAESPRGMPPSPGGAANGQAEDPHRFDEARYIIEHAVVPAEPINAFGIPQATMRCLELAESVTQMSELIQFSTDTKLGPIDALHTFAQQIRQARALNHGPPITGIPIHHSEGSSAFDGHGMNGLNGASQSMFMHNSGNAAGPSQGSPRNAGQSHNAPQTDGAEVKPPKGTAQPQVSGSTPSASGSTPASAPTPGGPTTPSMANATLKRKAPSGRTGEESPTTANADQPPAAKRAPRKRGRTQGSFYPSASSRILVSHPALCTKPAFGVYDVHRASASA